MLAEVERQADLEDLVKRLNKQWRDLISVRLLGPLAPYDFVVAAKPGG